MGRGKGLAGGKYPGIWLEKLQVPLKKDPHFCPLGLAEDFGRSFLQRRWTLQSPIHSGSDNGQPAGLGQGR